jgi:sodium transport system permease protein
VRTALDVLRVELLQLARDRRALFSAIVLPALLYPLLFWGTGALKEVGEETMAERTVRVLVDLDAVAPGTAEAFLAGLVDEGTVTLTEVDAEGALATDEVAATEAARALLEAPVVEAPVEGAAAAGTPSGGAEPSGAEGAGDVEAGAGDPGPDGADAPGTEGALGGGTEPDRAREGYDLLVVGTSDGGEPGLERATFDLWYDVKRDDAREAVGRARRALRGLGEQQAGARRERLLGGDPGAGLEPTVTDVATEEDASGARLGMWLPFVVLLVLISGGAYAALAVFAGEREAGTLETLLVQPVPHRAIAMGKLLTVFLAGCATLAMNLGSLLACAAAGLMDLEGVGETGQIAYARLASLLVELPACLLLCAVLCLVCGGARTFREGQLLIFPVTLLVVIPTAIVLRPEVSLTALWAVVPFSGSALALREGLEGDLGLPLAALVFASHLGWTWLAVARLGRVLDAERVLGGGGDRASEAHLLQAGGRHGVRWGFVVVMSVYLIAMSVQRVDMDLGLWFTFWFLLPALAVAIAWTAPRAAGEPRRLLDGLGLRLPRPSHALGALLLVPALVAGARRLLEWQSEVLPLPPGAEQGGVDLEALMGSASPWWLFFFFALSPGLFEELVFRGAMLRSMRRDFRWGRIVFWQALYFALVHASIYRLLPTGLLGALLALVALRSRSVLPAMLLHVGYNGLLVLGTAEALPFTSEPWFEHAPWAAVVGAALFLVPPRTRPGDGTS